MTRSARSSRPTGDDKRFAEALIRATKQDDVLDASDVERGRIVNLNLRGRLGALRKLPSLAKLRGLERMDVSSNRLEVLDLSRRPKRLFEIRARNNRLRAVDLRGCFDVEVVDLRRNQLRTLDVTGLVRVDELYVGGNPLTRLVVTDLLCVVHPALRRAAKRLVVRAATTHEIHYACDVHNWDDGRKLLKWAVRHPQCDPATALLIYFRAQPGYVFAIKRPDPGELRETRWLESIEARFARSEFNAPTVTYDPVKDVGADDVRAEHVNPSLNLRAVAVPGSPRYPFPRRG